MIPAASGRAGGGLDKNPESLSCALRFEGALADHPSAQTGNRQRVKRTLRNRAIKSSDSHTSKGCSKGSRGQQSGRGQGSTGPRRGRSRPSGEQARRLEEDGIAPRVAPRGSRSQARFGLTSTSLGAVMRRPLDKRWAPS